MATPPRQFLAFRFGSESRFEGQLMGALERIEAGGTVRVLDGLLVARERDSGELTAILLSDGPPSRITSRLLGFRLDERERRAATQRTLDGTAGETVRSLGALLDPGNAVAAVLVEHRWADALADAVTRVGGAEVVNEFVDAGGLAELTPQLIDAAQQVG
jgi:hypothetical protein